MLGQKTSLISWVITTQCCVCPILAQHCAVIMNQFGSIKPNFFSAHAPGSSWCFCKSGKTLHMVKLCHFLLYVVLQKQVMLNQNVPLCYISQAEVKVSFLNSILKSGYPSKSEERQNHIQRFHRKTSYKE